MGRQHTQTYTAHFRSKDGALRHARRSIRPCLMIFIAVEPINAAESNSFFTNEFDPSDLAHVFDRKRRIFRFTLFFSLGKTWPQRAACGTLVPFLAFFFWFREDTANKLWHILNFSLPQANEYKK